MNTFRAYEEWFKQSQYDYETAQAMVQSSRYIYCVFMCHLALEKAFKGLFQKKYQKVPPKTHDLIYLITVLEEKLSEDKISFVQILNDAHIRTRYPDNLESVLKEYTFDIIRKILIDTEELLLWIKEKSNEF